MNVTLPIPTEGWYELPLTDPDAAGVLGELARHYQECVLAAVAWDEQHPPWAVLQVSLANWPAGPLDALIAALAESREGDVGVRTVSVVDLPLGQAVRVRVLAGESVVSDVVQYWLPLPGRDLAIVAATSTAVLEEGDETAAVLDFVMPSLRVTD
jgi:hypothetical protein